MPIRKVIKKEPYLFSDSVSLLASSTGAITFSVNQGWDYALCAFTYTATVNNANTIPTFSFLIQENERKIFQNRVPNQHFAGVMTELSTAPDTRYVLGMTNPFVLPVPKIFPEKSDITIDLLDTSGQANTIIFTLIGYKKIYSYH